MEGEGMSKRSVITLSVAVDHDDFDDPIQIVEDILLHENEGRVNEIIEPHLDWSHNLDDLDEGMVREV